MRQIGKIKCLEVRNSTPASDDSADLVILFHGYGADAYDLQTLSEAITPRLQKNWLFPQGPIEVPIGPGWTGRAWWNLDMAAIQQAAQNGEQLDMRNFSPEGLKKIRPQLLEMIEQTKVPCNRVILGGFSQGAMLATDLFLNSAQAPKGLIIFSGQLICQNEWKPLIGNRLGKTFFMSHGNKDPILSYVGAQRLETLLSQNGMKGKLITFPGAHEIPIQAVTGATDYLNSLDQ